MASTPPHTMESRLQSLSLQDTPHSRGSCSQFPSHGHHLRRRLAPYLEVDVKDYLVEIHADYFLQNVLHFTASVDISIIQTDKYKDQVKEYCEASPERARYHPFVLLVGLVLKHKGSKESPIDITFGRNDPAVIKGSPAKRSPDIIGAYGKSIFISPRDSVDNFSRGGPSEAPFYWGEPVTYVEGKLKQANLTSSLLLPEQTPSPQVETSTRSSRARSARSPISVPANTPTNPPGHSAKATSDAPNKLKKKRTSTVRNPVPPRTTLHRDSKTKAQTRLTQSLPASYSHSVTSRYSTTSHSYSITSLSSSMASGASHETNDVAHYSDPMVQCASYALELLSQGGLRSHVIGLLITDSQLQLLYHDRSIIIVSKPFNFVTDSKRFVEVLNALSSLTASQWGLLSLNPNWKLPLPAKEERWVFVGKQLELNNGCVIELGEVISHQRGLIGRGTCVVRATCRKKGPGAGCIWDTKLVVKFSWPVKSRTPESEFLARIYESANAKPEHHWVLQHLPKLLHSEDRPHSVLSDALLAELGDKYEQRVLTILVFEELQPFSSLITSPDLAQSTIHVFLCYKWLYEIPKIMHRDISVNNLMYRVVDGKIFGVLNDFDLATYYEDTAKATSRQRTGTRPFMAIDRLFKVPPRHMYRHDLESLLYSLAWVAICYDNGEEIQNTPLQSWGSLNNEQLKDAKVVWLTTSDLQPTPNFVTLKVPLRQLRFLFSSCIGYRSNMYSPTDPGYFDETFDGRITFQTFGRLLQNLMDPVPSGAA